MSEKENKLERVPKANPSLAVLADDVGKSLFSGQPLDEHSTALAKGILQDFSGKITAQNMVMIAHLISTMPDALRGLRNVEDRIYDADWINAACNDVKSALELYKAFQDGVLKRIKIAQEFCKDLTMAMDRGVDPQKHLHVHLHAPVDEVNMPVEVVESLDSRRRVEVCSNLIEGMIFGKKKHRPVRKSRILDADDPDAQPIPVPEDE
jgi:hypothetical protein